MNNFTKANIKFDIGSCFGKYYVTNISFSAEKILYELREINTGHTKYLTQENLIDSITTEGKS